MKEAKEELINMISTVINSRQKRQEAYPNFARNSQALEALEAVRSYIKNNDNDPFYEQLSPMLVHTDAGERMKQAVYSVIWTYWEEAEKDEEIDYLYFFEELEEAIQP